MIKKLLRFLWKVGPRVLLPLFAGFYARDVGRFVLIDLLGAPDDAPSAATRFLAEGLMGATSYVIFVLSVVAVYALAKWLKEMWDKS